MLHNKKYRQGNNNEYKLMMTNLRRGCMVPFYHLFIISLKFLALIQIKGKTMKKIFLFLIAVVCMMTAHVMACEDKDWEGEVEKLRFMGTMGDSVLQGHESEIYPVIVSKRVELVKELKEVMLTTRRNLKNM